MPRLAERLPELEEAAGGGGHRRQRRLVLEELHALHVLRQPFGVYRV